MSKKKKYDDGYGWTQNFLRIIIIILLIMVIIAAFLIYKKANTSTPVVFADETFDSIYFDTEFDSMDTLPAITFEVITREPVVEIRENVLYDGFELPISGATGYVGAEVYMRSTPDFAASSVTVLSPGDCFMIIDDNGTWLQIRKGGQIGWIENKYCMVNMPDVCPSIVYDNTNSESSLFMSSGFTLPGVSGEQLYNAKSYNERLKKDEFVMPILYDSAKKLCHAQQLAIRLGYTYVVYETFRPYDIQVKVASSLSQLAASNKKVKSGITSGGWSVTWFISTSRSNHQYGFAFDTSLAQITSVTTQKIGKYEITVPQTYSECNMPTVMHELSISAVNYIKPYSSVKKTGWEGVELAPTMTDDAKLLRYISTSAGFIPLASEWWHFNDLDTKDKTKDNPSLGEFFVGTCLSSIPD